MALQSLRIHLVASLSLGSHETIFSGIAITGKFPGSSMRGIFTGEALQAFQYTHPQWGHMQNPCNGTHVEAQGYWRPAKPEEAGLMNMKTKSIFVVTSCTLTTQQERERERDRSSQRAHGNTRRRTHSSSENGKYSWRDETWNFMFADRHRDSAHCRTLGLDSMPKSKSELRTAWMKRIRETHPDKGGSESEAMMVNAAYQALLPAFG